MLRLTACTVDLDHGQVARPDGATEQLTPQERALLGFLVAAAGAPVPRERLLADVWGYSPNAVTRAVDVAVRRLRQKIEADPSDPDHVVTARGVGYRFDGAEPTPTPAPGHALVGRDLDLARGEALLAGCDRLAITGPPGVGTTAMARALCPGAEWLDLGRIPTGAQARWPERQVVVDGFGGTAEHLQVVDAVASTARQVVTAGPGRSGSPREAVLRLRGLDPEAGATLLRTHARRLVAGWGEDDDAVARIVQLLEGHPAALILAARRAEVLPAAALADHLEDRVGALALLVDAQGQPTLRDAWQHALAELPAPHAAALRRLAVFHGPFEWADAVAVWPDLDPASPQAGSGPAVVLEGLEALVRHSLLVPVPRRGAARFGVPWPVRALHPPDAAARDAHLQRLIAVLDDIVAQRFGPRWRWAAGRAAELAPDLDAAWPEADASHRCRLAYGASRARVGAIRARRHRLDAALAEADATWEPRLRLARADALIAANEAEAALSDLAAVWARLEAPDRVLARLVRAHADIFAHGDTDLDQVDAPEALADAGDGEAYVRRLHLGAAWHMAHGAPQEAEACFAQMQSWAVDHGHELVRARALAELGQLAWMRGETTEAEPLLCEALELLDGGGDEARRAVLLAQLGGLEVWRDDAAAARLYLAEALDVFVVAGDHRYAAATAANLGRVDYALGDVHAARRWLRQADRHLGPGGDDLVRMQVEAFAALGAHQLGRDEQVRRHADAAVAAAPSPTLAAWARAVRAHVTDQPVPADAVDTLTGHGAAVLAAWARPEGADLPTLRPVVVDLCVMLPAEWQATFVATDADSDAG